MIFPVLLTSQWGQVEVVVGPQKDIYAASRGRVRVQDLLARTEEHTQPRLLALVVGDPKIVVEVAAVRGVPGDGPAHARLIVVKLRERGPRDKDQRGVVGLYPSQTERDVV